MSDNYPIQSLLRPPIEWYSTLTASVVAYILLVQNEFFLMPSDVAKYSALGLGLFALYRFYQGYQVIRYQRNLKRLPRYTLNPNEILVSHKKLFIGRGFPWLNIHTQRLYDLNQTENAKYKRPSWLYQWLRKKEIHWEQSEYLRSLMAFTRTDSPWNPVRPYPDVGGQAALHGVSLKERDVWMNLSERNAHTLVLGTTRVGKTRLAELLISQDIHRGDCVIVIDPKGDGDLLKRIYVEAKSCGREDDVRIFHLGFPKVSSRYNPIGNFTRITEVANRVTNPLSSAGNSAAFKDFAWKYVNVVAKALVALQERPSYRLIRHYITRMEELLLRYVDYYIPQRDEHFQEWVDEYSEQHADKNLETRMLRIQAIKRYLAEHPQYHDEIIRDLYSAYRIERNYYDKITASIGPLLEKLCTGQCAELISPDYQDPSDHRQIIDWLQVIRNKQIVYVGLDALTDSTVSSAVGNAMFADLVSVSGRLYKYGEGGEIDNSENLKKNMSRVCIHSDEFNELIGDEFIPLLNKAGGAGFQVTAYTQTWSDVEARIGQRAKAEQIEGNFNTLIMLRVKQAATANILLNQLPVATINTLNQASSVSDSPEGKSGVLFHSNNEDRLVSKEVPMLNQNDIITLPKGQAFCLIEGGQLYKLRMPLPKSDEQDLPADILSISAQMKDHYQSNMNWWKSAEGDDQ